MSERRNNGRPFRRKRGAGEEEAAGILRAAASDVARKLVELAESEDPRIALAACKEILDRTQGRAEGMSKVELSGELAVTPAAILEAIRERRSATAQNPPAP